jgi:uncharacterized protein
MPLINGGPGGGEPRDERLASSESNATQAASSTGRTSAKGAISGQAALAETHISTVFVVGDRAYKLKKPVTTAFLNFSTPDLRRAACEREVALNRRVASDVYLGVAEVRDVDGNPCDYLTVMRRLPPDRRLAALVRGGFDVGDSLKEISHKLVAFHSRTIRSAAISQEGTVARVRERWEANFREAKYFESVLPLHLREEMEELVYLYLGGRSPLFERRIEENKIVDGHGDLLAEDIFCMKDGPRILDCIEFDDRLRYVDVLDDAAFLVMDLERLGRSDLGQRFIHLYREMSGDNGPQSLVHHYIAYRAFIRAKVAAMRASQGEKSKAPEVARCLQIARSHLLEARPTVVLVGGAPRHREVDLVQRSGR